MLANPVFIFHNRDIDGKIVERSMQDYPYSFTNTAVWKGDNYQKTTDFVCSDRLRGWDPEKFDQACKEVFGDKSQVFYKRSPEDIEKFLKKAIGIDLELTGIEIACNATNGYPYWVFYFAKIK